MKVYGVGVKVYGVGVKVYGVGVKVYGVGVKVYGINTSTCLRNFRLHGSMHTSYENKLR